jgi:TatD DNase family protein
VIDAHCHIDLYPDPLKEAKRIEERGDVAIAVTNLPSHYEMGKPYLSGYRRVKLALGLHPLLATHHAEELEGFVRLASEANYIGEIGLDFSPEGYRTKDTQLKSFSRVLETIQDRRRFLTIHSRRADRVVFEMLRDYEIQGAVFHWYSGSEADLERIAKDGHFFSVNQAMISSDRGRKLVARMPRDLVLTETDGPYILRQGRPILAADVLNVLEALAEIWGMPTSSADSIVRENFERALPPKGFRL